MATRSFNEKHKPTPSHGPLIKFMGACVIIAHFKFSFRRALWKDEASSKFAPIF